MAVIHDLIQTYDQSTALDQQIADGIHMITPTDTPLQLMFPKVQVGATKSEWIQDELVGQTTTLAATISATDTGTITVATGDGTDKFPTDAATYPVVVRIDEEYFLVTAIGSNKKLDVTHGYASTTKTTHSAGTKVYIISQLEHEGADGKKAMSRSRTRPSNYVQTFSRVVEVTGVEEAVKKLGGITSEIDYQIMQAMRTLARELEMTIIHGVKEQAGDGSSTYRTMGGLWAMIDTNSTADSGSVDTTAIEADIKTIWDAGGVPRAIVCDGAMAQSIANLYADRIRTDVQTQVGGVNITSIINPLGEGPIAIIPHRMMPSGEYFMLDTARIALGYIRPFFMKALANDGDADKRWIGGDYTLHLMNETAHARRRGFS